LHPLSMNKLARATGRVLLKIKSRVAGAGRSLAWTVAAAALCFALGVACAQFFQRDSSASRAARSAESAPSDAELMALFGRVDWNAKDLQEQPVLASALGRSEPLRSEVLKRYQQETRPDAKGNLLYLLAASPQPEVAAVALSWAQQAATRADGFKLLARQRPSAEVYRLAWQVIEQEAEPKVLAAAVWALNYPSNVLDPAEVHNVVPRLHALTQHDDEAVRAASIQQLAQWDKNKQYIEQDVLRIVNSEANFETKIAATGASSISALNSDELKRAFFKLLDDPATHPELRDVIGMQIDRFLLSPSEYRAYKKLASN
jgi:hypothetical protein